MTTDERLKRLERSAALADRAIGQTGVALTQTVGWRLAHQGQEALADLTSRWLVELAQMTIDAGPERERSAQAEAVA
ncbi:MAG: hypothetical protein ACLQMH_11205 [Solirubrobacteraceae bacterium]